MNWLAEHAIATALSIIGTIVAGFLAKKTGAIMDAIEVKAKIDIDDKLEDRVQMIVRKVVMAVTQTFVKGLKAKGEFTEDKKVEALEKAIEEAGSVIWNELGVVKSTSDVKLAVEAELGEQGEIVRVMRSSHEGKRPVKRKKKQK